MSFAKCLDVERESKRLLLPFVLERFGSAPKEIPCDFDSQRRGDWIVKRPDGYELYVELKAEVSDTGNVFLETDSNWHTTRYGWFLTSSADQLWYLFLDTRRLYIIQLGYLREWFWGDKDDVDAGACGRYRIVSQAKHEQHNLTKGYIVPVKDIMDALKEHCETVRV